MWLQDRQEPGVRLATTGPGNGDDDRTALVEGTMCSEGTDEEQGPFRYRRVSGRDHTLAEGDQYRGCRKPTRRP